MLGTLHVQVVEARELVNKDGLFGKNDAFCLVQVGSKKEKTEVIKNAGSKAKWNQSFTFPVPDAKTYLHIECMDYDKITSNDFIGVVNVPLNSIRQYGRIECWYPLTDNGKKTGEIHLFIRFEGPNQGNSATLQNPNVPAQHGISQQQGYPNYQNQPSHGSNVPQQGAYPPQQAAYPPQQGAYPPQQGAYPPQGGAYPPQQGGYPPQQGAYPPQQGAYPPQQGAYPPQQGAYPPQQGAYPPQQGAYPPQQGAYPPQQGAYPPQHGAYPPQQGGPPPKY